MLSAQRTVNQPRQSFVAGSCNCLSLYYLLVLPYSLRYNRRVAGEQRVSEAIRSTARNKEALRHWGQVRAQVGVASQAISQTVAASGAQQITAPKNYRGHARVLHDFGPAAFAGGRGASEGEANTAETMASALQPFALLFMCI